MSDLFNARVHYGHREGTLDVRMKSYIYGKRMDHIIFDLDKTALYLRKALNIAAHIAYRDGLILFVGRIPHSSTFIEDTAKQCGEYAHTREWIPHTFTNASQRFKGSIRLPDLCILLNTFDDALTQHSCVVESAKCMIPTIGIVDSNANPSLITYPVPGNDDSKASIELYCNLFKKAILRGKAKQKEDYEKEVQEQQQQASEGA